MIGVITLSIYFGGVAWPFKQEPAGSSPDNPLQGASADRFCSSFLLAVLRDGDTGAFEADYEQIRVLEKGFARRIRSGPSERQLSKRDQHALLEAGLKGRFTAVNRIAALARPNEEQKARETLKRLVGECQKRFDTLGLPPSDEQEPLSGLHWR